jgi:DNA-binding NarL/FixJ family response regulator
LKNQKEKISPKNQRKKSKKKKKGKIAEVYRLHQKGMSVKEIAEKMKLKESLVRAYIWRMKNPEKYRKLDEEIRASQKIWKIACI